MVRRSGTLDPKRSSFVTYLYTAEEENCSDQTSFGAIVWFTKIFLDLKVPATW
jgi:hypothetical protein